MIEISTATGKRKLLENLAKVANLGTDLIVEVHSLPTFLTTPIAFTIFNYQISNYPRKILWTSKDERILEFLKTCQVNILSDQNPKKSETLVIDSSSNANIFQQTNKILEINPRSENIESFDQEFYEAKLFQQENESYQDVQPRFQAKDLLSKEKYTRSTLLDSGFDEKNKETGNHEQTNQIQPVNQIQNVSQPITLKPYFKETESQVIDSEQIPKIANNQSVAFLETNFDQNLDNWLERIEATREALNSIRKNDEKKINKSSFLVRGLQFAGSTVILSVIILGFLILFPTNAYSLDILPERKETTTTLELSQNQFLTQDRTVSSTAESPATGIESVSLNKARGKVTLINNSGGDVKFDRTGIILVASNGNEYRHIPIAGEPNTFTVPARSNSVGGNVTINVEASGNGAGFNLAKDETLRILNLKRDQIGGLFIGVVTEEINVTKETGSKIITQKDLDTVVTNSTQQISEKSSQELQILSQNELIYTNTDWFRIENVENSFSNTINDVSEKVFVESTATVKLFYLNSNIISEELKIANNDILQVESVKSIDFEGDFANPQVNSSVEIVYTYLVDYDLDESELAQKLSSERDQEMLKKDYPIIQKINKQESGLRLPGVPARVDVTINEIDQE